MRMAYSWRICVGPMLVVMGYHGITTGTQIVYLSNEGRWAGSLV